MAIEVKYTPDFERQLKRLANKYPSIYKDLAGLIDELELTPHTVNPWAKTYTRYEWLYPVKAKVKVGVQE